MRGTVAAALGGAALVTIVALLVLLPGRLLTSGRISDPVVPAALPTLGVVHASVPPTAPAIHVGPPVHALARPTTDVPAHPAAEAAPRATTRRHVPARRHTVEPAAKPAAEPAPKADPAPKPQPTPTAVPEPVVPQPKVAPAAPAVAKPSPAPAAPAPVVVQTPVASAAVTAKPVPAVVPSVSVTVGSGKVQSTLVASVRDGSDAESAQYGDAAADQVDRTTGGADRDRADGVRPVEAAAGAATPAVAGAGAQARHEDRGDRGQARSRQDRSAP
jgi:hypothetical protein